MAYQFKASIVRILNKEGGIVGAGFLAAERLVFTCAHVVAHALHIPPDTPETPVGEVLLDFPLISPASKRFSGRIVLWRPVSMDLKQGADIAVLELNTDPPANSQTASLATVEDDLWGHSFRVFGFPAGFEIGEWAGGIIRDKLTNGWVVIEADKECAFFAEQGFSGTPVWDNKANRIVGMVAAVESQSGIKVGYFIPTDVLTEALSGSKKSLRLPRHGRSPCPYMGLYAFREEQAHLFFGREDFVRKLADAVQKRPLVAVIGPSGSGKSSAVFAGLVHSLRQRQTWLIASFQPGKRPMDSLAAGIIPLLEPELSETDIWMKGREVAEVFRHDKNSLEDYIDCIMEKYPADSSLLLIVDQFEEVFTLCREEVERDCFLTRLLSAVRMCGEYTQSARLILVLTMRADFLNHALSYDNLAEALQYNVFTLGPMSHQGLENAIVKPARQLKVRIEEGLTERILESVSKAPGNLPLLEFALTQLWEKQQDGRLTHAAYDEIGGVEKALTRYAEEKYGKLNQEEQQSIHRIFIQLVRPGEGTEDTCRIATRTDVGGGNWGLVKQLADARLVVTDRDRITGEETVEIVHEALINGWERLRQWMKEDRIFRSWQERLRIEMHQWEAKGRDESALLRGSLLAEAEDWLLNRPEDLSGPEQTYIKTSKTVDKQRQRLIAMGITTFITIVITIAVFAAAGWRHASKERDYAETQRHLAIARLLVTQSELTKKLHPNMLPLSALLATEAMRRVPSLEADQALRQALALLPRRVANMEHDGPVRAVAFTRDQDHKYLVTAGEDQTIRIWDTSGWTSVKIIRHSQPVHILAVSPDGRFLAAGAYDHETAQIYHLPDGREISAMKHRDSLTGIVFSPDGKSIGTASWDQTACLWDTETGVKRFSMPHTNKVTGIVFSPDGKSIGTTSWDHTACLWDAETGKKRLSMPHANKVTGIAFSPDGKSIATASWDHTACLWDAETGKKRLSMPHASKVTGITFSPDGRWIATSSEEHTVCIWDAWDGVESARISHTDRVNAIIFSPESNYLATACKDGAARVWDVEDGKETIRMVHQDEITAVVFSPDGKYLTTAGMDRAARVWETSSICTDHRIKHDDEVTAVAFSPDGRYLTTISRDHTAGLWETKNCREIARLRHDWEIADIAFSMDSRFLATAGTDCVVRIRDIKTGHEAGRLEHDNGVKKALFSPDGRFLLTVCEGNITYIWDMINGRNIKKMPLECHLNAIAFSPDGRTLAAACRDNYARLWEVKGPREIAPLSPLSPLSHPDEVLSVAFSPDGKLLATACRDNNARLWEIKGPKEIIPLSKLSSLSHPNKVTSISFSPDGRYLATACGDNNVRLWDINAPREISPLSPLSKLSPLSHPDEVTSISFSPDGRYLATACRDNFARMWDIKKGKETARIPHADAVLLVTFSPDGSILATACRDRTARIWDKGTLFTIDVNPYQQIACIRHEWQINHALFSPDGKDLATAGEDHVVRIWKTSNPKQVSTLKHEGDINAIVYSPDGRYIVTADANGKVRLYDNTTDYQEIAQKGVERGVPFLAFIPTYIHKGNRFVTVEGDGKARIWDIFNRKITRRHMNNNDIANKDITNIKDIITGVIIAQGVYALSVCPDGRYLATVHEDRTLNIWDAATQKKISTFDIRDVIHAIAFSPDGRYLATAGEDKTVQIRDSTTGKIISSMKHVKRINAIGFSPDGRYLATASEDRTACIWETNSGREIIRLTHDQGVHDVVFNPNGSCLATASADHTARKWLWHPEDMITEACARLTQNLTSQEWLQYIGNEPYCKTCPALP